MTAQIYLASHHGVNTTETSRSFCIFNFESFYDASRAGFGKIRVLNEDTLLAGAMLTYDIPPSTGLFVLPIVGSLLYRDDLRSAQFVDPGQSLLRTTSKPGAISIHNTYETEMISYVIMLFQYDCTNDRCVLPEFDLDEDRNVLHNIFALNNFKIRMGQFEGRKDISIHSSTPQAKFFAMVLAGAFECQDRLLERHDALSLDGVSEVSFEALSSSAIMLMIEQ